jgi:hypothetical protein
MKSIRLIAAAAAVLIGATLVGNSAPAPSPSKAAAPKVALIVVPADYHAKTQPTVYFGSKVLTGMGNSGGYAGKYKKVYGLLQRDQKLIANIKKVAAIYGIDPIHIIGAIVGEHTYNIDTYDTLQTYYVKALQYVADKSLRFEYNGQAAVDLFKKPQFARCEALKANYEIWDCRETVWNQQFYGKMVDGRLYPRDRLHRVFFRPMFSGQTFGIGQLSPVTALMVSDLVHQKSGLPLLSIDDAPQVYQQIMSPDTSLHYIAAEIRVSIDVYKRIAGFDISQNPGITATLYNLGDSVTRATELRALNQKRKAGEPPVYPEENFYGWFVNDRASELRKLL